MVSVRNCALWIVLVTLLSCQKDSNLNDYISNKYSDAEINFFYEACFNDSESNNTVLRKWYKDIYFSLEGDTLVGDNEIILRIANEINKLNLPIKFYEADNHNKPNLIIVSQSEKQLELEYGIGGKAYHYRSNGIIDSASLLISKFVGRETRESLFRHEFLHVLGFTSHVSTTNFSNIFYLGDNKISRLSNKEIKALHILYEPIWPKKYGRKDFEKDFYNNLYHKDSKSKFLDYLQSNNIDKSLVKEILEHGTVQYNNREPEIFKVINHIPIIFKEEVPKHIFGHSEAIIAEINTATPNLTLSLSKDTTSLTGIFISFTVDEKLDKDSVKVIFQSQNITSRSKLKAIYSTSVNIRYNSSFSRFPSTLALIIYQLVSLKDVKYKPDAFIIEENDIHLKPYYKELLKLYYAPELPHNFTKSELEEVIREYDK